VSVVESGLAYGTWVLGPLRSEYSRGMPARGLQCHLRAKEDAQGACYFVAPERGREDYHQYS